MLKNDRYIGGGKVFFTPVGGTEYEIGEVQEATLTFNVETADAYNKDQTIKKKVAKVVKGVTSSIKFTTQITNAKNTAIAMLGVEETEDYIIGDTLPDGTVATGSITIPVIRGGKKPLIEGELKFIGDEDGDTKPVLVVYNAVLTPTSDIGYIVEDFSKLSFEGEVMETVNGYADEYRMTVGV